VPVAFISGDRLAVAQMQKVIPAIDAERAAFVPGLVRSDAHNVKGSSKDMIGITKLLQVLTSLEAP